MKLGPSTGLWVAALALSGTLAAVPAAAQRGGGGGHGGGGGGGGFGGHGMLGGMSRGEGGGGRSGGDHGGSGGRHGGDRSSGGSHSDHHGDGGDRHGSRGRNDDDQGVNGLVRGRHADTGGRGNGDGARGVRVGNGRVVGSGERGVPPPHNNHSCHWHWCHCGGWGGWGGWWYPSFFGFDPFYYAPYDYPISDDRRERRSDREQEQESESKEYGNVELHVDPEDTLVYVNGTLTLTKGHSFLNLPAGHCTLRFVHRGYRSQDVEFDVQPGIGYRIDRQLRTLPEGEKDDPLAFPAEDGKQP